MADAWYSGHRIGTFELRGAVSRSASGIVYRAWDHGLATPVAVKEHLPAQFARRLANGDVFPISTDTQSAYDRSLHDFIEGTRALARCDHPALVRALHLHTGHGTAYRVMPWVVGDPLREMRYAMPRPPDEPTLRGWLDDLLGALEALHRTGTVHGGVHPSQILLLPGGRLLLLGVHPVAEEAGGAPGPWTDLRALADVARFCISGVPPTADGRPVEPTAQILERLIFHDGAVHYGQEFMRVLDAAASPDVSQRPQSVAQFRERLRHAAIVDTGAEAAEKGAPIDTLGPNSERTARDAAVETMIQRVIEAIPPRTTANLRPPRPARKPAIDAAGAPPLTTVAARPRRRARIGARVVATLLAVVAYGAWQWLDRPMPADVDAVVTEVVPPAPSEVQSPDPVIAAQPPKTAAPAIEAVAPPVATEAAPPVAVTPIESKATPAEQDAPARSPREACGERTPFSLYLCMQRQCTTSAWTNHPQCVRFRATDQVE